MVTVRVKKLHPDAILPKKQTKGSAGADVYAIEDIGIPALSVKTVRLGLAVEVPENYELQIRPRSGLAANHSVTVLNSPGTIDSDFRGELQVILANHKATPFMISKGDRIAQIVCQKIPLVYYEEVNHLESTSRGASGFGSTGRA